MLAAAAECFIRKQLKGVAMNSLIYGYVAKAIFCFIYSEFSRHMRCKSGKNKSIFQAGKGKLNSCVAHLHIYWLMKFPANYRDRRFFFRQTKLHVLVKHFHYKRAQMSSRITALHHTKNEFQRENEKTRQMTSRICFPHLTFAEKLLSSQNLPVLCIAPNVSSHKYNN